MNKIRISFELKYNDKIESNTRNLIILSIRDLFDFEDTLITFADVYEKGKRQHEKIDKIIKLLNISKYEIGSEVVNNE